MKNLAVLFCIFFSFQSSATAQTLDLNVSCPILPLVDSNVVADSHQSHQHHADCGCNTCTVIEQSNCDYHILQQNQMLKIQFGKAQMERKNLMIEFARQQAETDASIEDLKRSFSKIAADNQSSIRTMAKQSAQREEKLLFEMRSFGREFEELAEKLVAANLQSVKNSNALIDYIKHSSAKNAKFQKQVSENLKSIQKGLKGVNSVHEHVEENHRQTEKMFSALDEDMEDIRKKMDHMQKDDSNRQKAIQGKLNLLKDIAEHLHQKSEKEKKETKKESSKKNSNKRNSKKKESNKKKPEPKRKKKKK